LVVGSEGPKPKFELCPIFELGEKWSITENRARSAPPPTEKEEKFCERKDGW
jgi:hypothetical protein